MKNSTTLLLFIFMMSLFGVSNAQVKSDYDRETDFTKFSTYTFAGWQKDSDKQLNDFDKKRILEALKSELEERGMTPVISDAEADVTIALFVVLNNKTSTTAYTDYMGGMGYGPGWGWGMGAGMGTATTTYTENDYVEGTLVVDMYDEGSKKLVWQGVLTTIVKEDPEKRQKTIPKNIKKLMKEYPVAPQKK